jgi:tetratricopeptide (TPR) repeat protein
MKVLRRCRPVRGILLMKIVCAFLLLTTPARAGSVEDSDHFRVLNLTIQGSAVVIGSNKFSDLGYNHAYRRRGLAHEFDLAIRDHSQVLRIDPDNRTAYENRAWTLYLKGLNKKALADARRSLSIRPGYADTLYTRAQILAATATRNEVFQDFEADFRAGGSDRVRKHQKALARLGYYKGPIDGLYGHNTRAALIACLNAGCRIPQ